MFLRAKNRERVEMKRAILFFEDLRLGPSQISKFREFIGNLFKDYDVINYDASGERSGRYPLIQFKLINREPAVPAIITLTDKAVNLFSVIFMNLNKIVIDEIQISVHEKNLQIEEVGFGWSTDTYVYQFMSPWIGMDQKDCQTCRRTKSVAEKDRMLKKYLLRDVLFMSEYVGYRPEPVGDRYWGTDQKIGPELRLKEETVHLKGEVLTGFTGIFKTNFIIPDYLGIGKSVLQGFGTVKRII